MNLAAHHRNDGNLCRPCYRMKNDPLVQFTNIRNALLKEKADHLARLAAIDKALDLRSEVAKVNIAVPTPAPEPAVSEGPKRKVSKATRAKMAAAQRARRAKATGNTAVLPAKSPATQPSTPAKKAKRKISAEAKAAMSAAAKARWAKRKAEQKPA